MEEEILWTEPLLIQRSCTHRVQEQVPVENLSRMYQDALGIWHDPEWNMPCVSCTIAQAMTRYYRERSGTSVIAVVDEKMWYQITPITATVATVQTYHHGAFVSPLKALRALWWVQITPDEAERLCPLLFSVLAQARYEQYA